MQTVIDHELARLMGNAEPKVTREELAEMIKQDNKENSSKTEGLQEIAANIGRTLEAFDPIAWLKDIAEKIRQRIQETDKLSALRVKSNAIRTVTGAAATRTVTGAANNHSVKQIVSMYHSGGIVGNVTRLKSTEIFAKLLKGEFVATPQMMNKFLNYTLPTITSAGGRTEINSPLISIHCDSVTQESLPRLEEIVNEAVRTIKKQFDDGLGRAGYHKTVKQII